jgi:hypothetical protein
MQKHELFFEQVPVEFVEILLRETPAPAEMAGDSSATPDKPAEVATPAAVNQSAVAGGPESEAKIHREHSGARFKGQR